jgi:Cytochrome c7 and related cytochrome c
LSRGLASSPAARAPARAGWLLAAAVAAAACKAAVSPPQTPEPSGNIGTEMPDAALDGATPGASAATASAAPPASSGAVALPPPAAREETPVEMIGPSTTGFATELQALGLDPRNLPLIDKLEPKALRGAMKLFAKSLGVKCVDCHEEGNFAAPTRRKRIATRMWNEFVVKLAMSDGAPLFCDSCHKGRVIQLDRRDKKALAAWMDANFVTPLSRKDGGTHDCETCHVDMDMNFLASWGAVGGRAK